MAKITNRDRILSEGLRVVHTRGLVGASVRDIIQAAGVPQGSFSNHFKTKEQFVLEVFGMYEELVRSMLDRTVRNTELAPLARLRAYYAVNIENLDSSGLQNGCLIGNFSIEAGEHSQPIREAVVRIFSEISEAVADAVEAAKAAGEIDSPLPSNDIASFLISALQGAILRSKVEQDWTALANFDLVFFTLLSASAHPSDRAKPRTRRTQR